MFVPAPDGSARILDLDGHFFAVSAVGAEMIQAALERGIAAASSEIGARYEIAPEIVRADVEELLANLRRRGLLCRSDKNHHRGTSTAAILLVPLLVVIREFPCSLSLKAGILLTAARFSCTLFGWAKTVAAWQRTFAPKRARPATEIKSIVDRVHEAIRDAASRLYFRVECKERALASWALLSWAKLPANLVVGVEFYPFAGHCWCTSGDRIVGTTGIAASGISRS
jgi:hypothetical protein